MREMYDSVTPNAIPSDAIMVAGYVDGRYAWSNTDWARFPNAIKVRIAVFPQTDDGHVLDCETGDATPGQCPAWVVMRRRTGVDPAVYCDQATWPAVIAAFRAQNVQEPNYWIAAYPGIGKVLYPGSVAHQYADPTSSGGDYDKSVVADYWPGIDTSPTQKDDDMATTPIYLQNKTTGQRAHLMDDGWMIVLTEPVTDVILTNSAVVQTVSAADWAAYLTHSDLIDANRQALVALSPVFSAVLESVKALTAAVQNMPTVAGGGMTEVQFEQKYAELSSRTVDTTTHTVKPVGTV